MTRVKAGDGVLWPDGSMGRVADGPNEGYCNHDEVHVCREQGSAFTADGGVTLSVSGGPFDVVKVSDLAPTGEEYTAWFWRWGPNGSGKGKGVDFNQQRPVWEYTGAHDYVEYDGRKLLRIKGAS